MGSLTILQASLLAPIIILGLECIAIGASILLRRQPLVINGLVVAWVLIISALPINAGFLYLAIIAAKTALLCYGIFIVLIQVVAYSAAIRAMRGIFIFGTSMEGIRTALRAALDSIPLAYSESIMGFDLSEQPGRLQVAITQRLGTAQIRLVDEEDATLHSAIARGIKTYFQKNRGDFSLQSALIYGGFGIFGLLLAIYQCGRF